MAVDQSDLAVDLSDFGEVETAPEPTTGNFPPSAFTKWVNPLSDNEPFSELVTKEKEGKIRFQLHTNNLSGVVVDYNSEGGIPSNYQSRFAVNGEVPFIKIREINRKSEQKGWDIVATLTLFHLNALIVGTPPKVGDYINITYDEDVQTEQNPMKKFDVRIKRHSYNKAELREFMETLPVADKLDEAETVVAAF